MVERRAATPGSLWAPASSFFILTGMQKVHTEVEFKGVLARGENVGFFIAEEPKKRLLGRGRGAGRQGSFSKDTQRSPSASIPMILKIRSPLMLSVTEPRTRIWTWLCRMVRQAAKPGGTTVIAGFNFNGDAENTLGHKMGPATR